MIGYNPEAIRELGTKINTSCKTAAEEIISALEQGVINPISTVWYTPEGKDFFMSFAQTVQGTAPTIQEAFDGFRASIQNAANNWAENTAGGETAAVTVDLSSVDMPDMVLNVDAIQSQNGDVIGIDEDGATKVASGLEGVYSDIQEKLSNIANELDASTAFVGGEQASAVQSCFVKVNQAVSKIFEFLTQGDESLMSQINKAVSKYGSVATDISSAFNASE